MGVCHIGEKWDQTSTSLTSTSSKDQQYPARVKMPLIRLWELHCSSSALFCAAGKATSFFAFSQHLLHSVCCQCVLDNGVGRGIWEGSAGHMGVNDPLCLRNAIDEAFYQGNPKLNITICVFKYNHIMTCSGLPSLPDHK